MREVLTTLAKSNLFYVSSLQLRVLPAYRSLALTGFIRLRSYEPFAEEEKRFEGGEAKQIKAALKKLFPTLVIEVKTNPDAKRFKGGAYEFSITETFQTSEQKQDELKRLREAGVVSEHVYPVARSWAEKISGSEGH